MKIISGKFKGSNLLSPNDHEIRPTTNRSKEMIFNTLNTILFSSNIDYSELDILDGFCGTGSLGIEALSRGAKKVTFVDLSKKSIQLAKSNCKKLNIINQCSFLVNDLSKEINKNNNFDLFFLDPPYQKDLINDTLDSLYKKKWISKGCIGVIEVKKGSRDFSKSFLKNIKVKSVRSSYFFFIKII